MVDWTVALNTATKLVRPGPEISRQGAAAVVAELRSLAARAETYVREVTGMEAASGTAPVLVVDRQRWIQANLDGFRQILLPLNAKVIERMKESSPTMANLGPRITGVEVGALLSYLSSKVLGQFDPFFPGADAGAPGGRLLLVAPNIVSIERELDVDPADFRLWVCLHEETHRVQFAAVPWLRGYLNAQVAQIVDSAELDPTIVAQMLREALRRVVDAVSHNQEVSIIDLVQTPAQRETVDRVTAVMSLLEGHADVVMDGVGPEVVPSVAAIRERFEGRRRSGNPLERMLRRLFGIEMKMKQYAEGAAFVREVVDEVGMAGLNRVWSGPEMLPTGDEIRDPVRWLTRTAAEPPAVTSA
jgi:coenzyme F420 biosynthesis associated uncharacterized protein